MWSGGAEPARLPKCQKRKPRRASAFGCFVRRKEWKIELQRFFDKPADKSGYRGFVNFLTFCKKNFTTFPQKILSPI